VRFVPLVLLVLALAACGSSAQPKADPGRAALRVVDLIVHNRYAVAWDDLTPADKKVAPLDEYVGCETRSPVLAAPVETHVVRIRDESVGLGNGMFVKSKAVDVGMRFRGNFKLVHTVHLVASNGKWTWILPSWRYRDYRADKCPIDAGSTAPPQSA
jgi:hypothetical protein